MIGGVIIGTLLGGILGAYAGGVVVGGILGVIGGSIIGIAVFSVLYELIEAFSAASPGKRILKIKIGNADGTAAGLNKLLGRYAIKNIALLFSVLATFMKFGDSSWVAGLLGLAVFVGCFFALGSAKQTLHDLIVKTAVYPKESCG